MFLLPLLYLVYDFYNKYNIADLHASLFGVSLRDVVVLGDGGGEGLSPNHDVHDAPVNCYHTYFIHRTRRKFHSFH